jgi:hypothetical protein
MSYEALWVVLNFIVVGKGLTGKDLERTFREMIVAFALKA